MELSFGIRRPSVHPLLEGRDSPKAGTPRACAGWCEVDWNIQGCGQPGLELDIDAGLAEVPEQHLLVNQLPYYESLLLRSRMLLTSIVHSLVGAPTDYASIRAEVVKVVKAF